MCATHLRAFDDEFPAHIAATLRCVVPWLGSHRLVVADSWFGSPANALALLRHGLYSVMFVKRRGRGWPRNFPGDALLACINGGDYGTSAAMEAADGEAKIVAAGLRSRKPQLLVATCGSMAPSAGKTVVVKEGEVSKQVTYLQPQLFQRYGELKHAIDDHNNLCYNLRSLAESVRTRRWWLREALHIFQVIEANSWAYYRWLCAQHPELLPPQHREATIKSHAEFRLLLCDALCGWTDQARPRVPPSHLLTKIGQGGLTGRAKRACPQGVCVFCRKFTTWKCTCGPRAMCVDCHQQRHITP